MRARLSAPDGDELEELFILAVHQGVYADWSAGADDPRPLAPRVEKMFAPAPHLDVGEWTLAGGWRVEDEWVEARQAGARITYRFQARDVHLVMGPAGSGRPVRFRVRIDGRPPGADHGTDVDANGDGEIDGHRLYQLVRQAGGDDRPWTIEIELFDPGARAYAFTFG